MKEVPKTGHDSSRRTFWNGATQTPCRFAI